MMVKIKTTNLARSDKNALREINLFYNHIVSKCRT